jgi:DNA topoisomerase-1
VRILVIAEKPSSAGKIAQALAEGGPPEQKKKGKASYYELARGKDELLVAPAVGHLYGLTSKSKGYPVWDPEWKASHETSEFSAFTKPYLETLAALAKRADALVVACDFDVEGSLIGWNLARFLAPGKPVQRMKFSTLTLDELREAWEARGEMDTPNALAGEARHELDWLWGINASRALMSAIKKGGTFRIMSIGRVQGPSLALLAERERAIAAFKPEPYWELSALVKKAEFAHAKNPFQERAEADKAHKASKPDGVVEKVTRKDYLQNPPHPYDLTSLQVDAYRAFGFTPKQSLEHAQRLYEAAVISYPRTSSQQLPERLNLKKIVGLLAGQAEYSKHAGELQAQGRFKPHNGPKEDPAHPAIHPTGLAPGKLLPQQQRLYDLIVRRFLATLAPAAKRERQKVELKLGEEPYEAQGARTLEPGWLAYFPYAKLEEVELPPFKEGERVRAENVELAQKETQPPKRYSPASLVKKLEGQGLGTKATRAEIIETLFNRGYCTDKRAIQVTPLGMAVVEAFRHDAPEILSEELTRKFEAEMELIQASRKDAREVVEEGRAVLAKILAELKAKEGDIGGHLMKGLQQTERAVQLLGKCPTCSEGSIVVKRSRFGLFGACDRYPACKQTYPFPKQALIKPTGKACEFCRAPVVTVIRKARRPFSMCLTVNCKSKESWGKAKAQGAKEPSEPAPED